MSRKQKKIIVGTAVVTLAGWIFAEGMSASDFGFLLFAGIPCVVGCGWAFLAKGNENGT